MTRRVGLAGLETKKRRIRDLLALLSNNSMIEYRIRLLNGLSHRRSKRLARLPPR